MGVSCFLATGLFENEHLVVRLIIKNTPNQLNGYSFYLKKMKG